VRWLREFDAALGEVDGHTFYEPALGPDAVVADLGAAHAHFARALADRFGCRAYAAEALPSVHRQIPAHPRLTAFAVAISGVDGRLRLTDRATHHASASYGRFDALPDKGSVEVDSATLEGFMRRADITRLDLLKVDIEGAEFAMFDTARDETLAAIGQITVEFHDFLDPALEPACHAVIRRLEGLGFSAIRFSRRGHGDVLFLNRAKLGLSPGRIAWFRHVVRPLRGLGRMLGRRFEPAVQHHG
jgi:FkbM family methyltransferase